MLRKYEELEETVIAAIALMQEEQKVVSALIDAAEAQGESNKKLYGQINEAGKSLTRKIEAVLATIPNEIRQGAQTGAHKAVQGATADVAGSLEAATQSLKTATTEGQATARALSRTGILLGVFLLAVGVVVGLIGWAGVGFMVKNRGEELANLKAQVEAEKATLAKMRSETWGIELVTFGDGERAIILPKGYKYKYAGDMKDKNGKKTGRIGVAIEPF